MDLGKTWIYLLLDPVREIMGTHCPGGRALETTLTLYPADLGQESS